MCAEAVYPTPKILLEYVGDGVVISTPLGDLLVSIANNEVAISSKDISYTDERSEDGTYIEVWN